VESLSLEILKICLDTVLGNLLGVTLLENEVWFRVYPEVSSNLNSSVILCSATMQAWMKNHGGHASSY